jgi:hypothetical protein
MSLSHIRGSLLAAQADRPVHTPLSVYAGHGIDADCVFHKTVVFFSHPDFTVGFGISPNQPFRLSRQCF